ncbi:MarR family winged helix-turn-helix transcriptional regulator [Actinacidiphila soli]|jgi:DNA-binding MarR family transcriptional regulator|uniref:MarR family winged helix-turn-helix transcriptional regulator n=1 Tax=Actinacidiphila soli TaxID=2487275 RepID=UPI000FCA9254|nr:MarR family transcriptional regulator [Actinacidiphila soli]
MGEPTRLEDEAGVCPGAEEVEVLRRWRVIDGGLRRITDQLLADVHDEVGLPPSELHVVCFLAESPEQAAPMRQLSELLGFSTAGTTGVVDRLADAGLVERRPSRTDRRVTFAALTELGRRTASAAVGVLAEAVRRRIAEPLGDDGFAALEAAVGSLGGGSEPEAGCPRSSAC